MNQNLISLVEHLAARVRRVQENLGQEITEPAGAEARLGDLLDSMGMVEFLALMAGDCGTTVEALEQAAGFRFGTLGELAGALEAAGIGPRHPAAPALAPSAILEVEPENVRKAWLAGTTLEFPERIQPASALNEALGKPSGWLESHAGIFQRHLWGEQDPLAAAASAGRECLERAGILAEEIGLLLVTSEAPPLLAGLAAAVHNRLGLRPTTPALEVGGACTGFLAALWLARQALGQVGAALVVAVEAPSRFLALQPGPAGEAAALFGDGAAACLLSTQSAGEEAVPLDYIVLGADGGKGKLIRVERSPAGVMELMLEGPPLALLAVRVMAQSVRDILRERGVALSELRAVVAHGGNGRLPGMLARELGLPPEMVWSETARAGNLGSASLPAAWAARQPGGNGPVVWTAVGAGLTWGAMLTGRDGPGG